MAVLKVKPERIVQLSVPIMQRQLLTPSLITRVSGDQFVGSKGDEVIIKVRGLKAKTRDYEWRTRNAPIVMDDIAGGYAMRFRLNKHLYSATSLTDEHFTMDEINLATEVFGPQAEAVADKLDLNSTTAFRNLSWHDDLVLEADISTDPHLVATEAKRRLDAKKTAPYGDRVFLVGSDVGAAWVASDRLSKYEWSGESGTPAVRNATIGSLSNSPVVVHPELLPKEAYYIHKTSLFIASVAPKVPNGAASGSTRQERGFGLRFMQDYDTPFLRDRAITSTFWGINELRDELTPAGKWRPEVGEMDDDELVAAGDTIELSSGSPWPVGTRKNVRVVKIVFSGDVELVPPVTP